MAVARLARAIGFGCSPCRPGVPQPARPRPGGRFFVGRAGAARRGKFPKQTERFGEKPGSGRLTSSLQTEVDKLTNAGYNPVVLTSPAVRLYFRKLVSRSIQGLVIVSHAEIDASVEIQILGVVRL